MDCLSILSSALILFVSLQFVAKVVSSRGPPASLQPYHIALPGIFMQRLLPGCCPKATWLAHRQTFYRIFYRASANILETALHINIKCNGDFPGAAQERLGSLNDHYFIVI